MYTKTAKLYDALYGFKDYAAAANEIFAVIRRHNPEATTLLDAACGTGRHLAHLRRSFAAEGLDINPELLDIARRRCPGTTFYEVDMVDFELGKRFDDITCLFSSIAYVRTLRNMRAAVAAMVRHLNPRGILLIEPWFTPESCRVNHITTNFVDEPDLKIAWMYVNRAVDRLSVLDIDYLVGSPAGVQHFTERHELGLFAHAEYLDALRDAGLNACHDPVGPFGRGLYVGLTGPARS